MASSTTPRSSTWRNMRRAAARTRGLHSLTHSLTGSKMISTDDPKKFLDIGGDHISGIVARQKIPSYLASEKYSIQIVNNELKSKEETKLEVIQDASQQEEEECV